jgi:hypothetical protein
VDDRWVGITFQDDLEHGSASESLQTSNQL